MARYLFVVPPLVGHVNPTVSVAQALATRGHDVAWVAHPRAVRPHLPQGAQLFELDDHVPEERWQKKNTESRALRGLAAFKFLWEEFLLPLAYGMISGIERAIDLFLPDVLVVDQQAVAGAVVARKRQIRWATLSTTSAGLIDPLSGLPLVRAWLNQKLADLERHVGLIPSPHPDCSPWLLIAFTTNELVGLQHNFPPHYRLVGPAMGRPEPGDFSWNALKPNCKRVLVTMGTVNFDTAEAFYHVAVEALGNGPLQVILVAPGRLFSQLPENIILRESVPQLALLPHLHGVVCHAGHNTVCETLAHGLPLVVVPIKDDQPIVADQVERCGAGIRLKFGRVRPVELRTAVHRVLEESSFVQAAKRIQSSFAEAGGAPKAAQLLEEIR